MITITVNHEVQQLFISDKYLPRETFAVVTDIFHPPGHYLGQFLLIDANHFFLRDVVVLVLL